MFVTYIQMLSCPSILLYWLHVMKILRHDNWSWGSKLTPGPFNYEARVLAAVPAL